MLKVFPRSNDGFNAYEYQFDWYLYKLEQEGTNEFQFKMDNINRKFNPLEDLKYESDGHTLGNLQYTYTDDTLADDTRCESMKKYIIPMKCCKSTTTSNSTISSTSSSSDENECKPNPLSFMDSSMWINDVPDDNYSFAEGIVKEYNLDPEAVIFTRGHWEDALKLFGGLQFDGNNTAEMLLETTPYLIFPTGSLAPMQESAIFKNLIEQYVRQGGVIIIFAQQTGSEVEKLIPRPSGEKLKVYGWREDSSCLRDSVYYTSMSGPVSSSTIEI
jgi:hypothetical protein